MVNQTIQEEASNNLPLVYPTYQGLQKENIAPTTFTEWIKDPNHVYIGTNLKKYSRDPDAVDTWGHLELNRKLFYATITLDEYHALYEDWVRREKWSEIESLSGKQLGCWCISENRCAFKTLLKLFKEKLLLRRLHPNSETEIGFNNSGTEIGFNNRC